MKVHNKNLIILMIISIFVLVTTSILNINLSAQKIKENEIKKLNSDILLYKNQIESFYEILNNYNVYLEKIYDKDDFSTFAKSVQSFILSNKYVKSGEIYSLNNKKLTYIGKTSDYANNDWISLIKENKKERIISIEGRLYYINELKQKGKSFGYIFLELDKETFFKDFFATESYFILDSDETFFKEDSFNKPLLYKIKTMSKGSGNIYEFNEGNSYAYYTYIKGIDWVIGMKGNYYSAEEKFMLIKNFSLSSIAMIVIFGLLGIKSNKENISKPLMDLTDFLKNREDRELIKSIEFKEKSELNEFVSAFDSYIDDHDKILKEIKKGYADVFKKNILIIRDFEEYLKNNKFETKKVKTGFVKNIKKTKELLLKFLTKTDKSLKHLNGDFENVSDKIAVTEKKINGLSIYLLNILALNNDSDKLLEQFEAEEISSQEYINKIRQKNKRIKDNYESFSGEISKVNKSLDGIKILLDKAKDYKDKADSNTIALIESINNEIKEFNIDSLNEYEIELENADKEREVIISEIKKRANNFKYIKSSLGLFMEKLNKI